MKRVVHPLYELLASALFASHAGAAAEPSFKHTLVDQSLPVNAQGYGDYGLTALVDLDRDGDLDFVLGGRPSQPSQLYWYEFQKPGQWVRHLVGTNYLSDVGLAALDVDGDGWTDLVCSEELLSADRQNPRWILWQNLGGMRFQERIILDVKLGGHELQAGDVDGDGRIDICSKAWGPRPWNSAGGKMHVDFLENLLR